MFVCTLLLLQVSVLCLFFDFRGAIERLSNILWVCLQGIQNEPPEYLVVLSGGSQAKI